MSALKNFVSYYSRPGTIITKVPFWDPPIYLFLAPWLISKRTKHILFAIDNRSLKVKNMHLKAFRRGAFDCQR